MECTGMYLSCGTLLKYTGRRNSCVGLKCKWGYGLVENFKGVMWNVSAITTEKGMLEYRL